MLNLFDGGNPLQKEDHGRKVISIISVHQKGIKSGFRELDQDVQPVGGNHSLLKKEGGRELSLRLLAPRGR
jgi:hypothetical protein